MKIFVAGGTGAIGRPLLDQLLARGHNVIALTRSQERAQSLAAQGIEPAIADVFDPDSVEDCSIPFKLLKICPLQPKSLRSKKPICLSHLKRCLSRTSNPRLLAISCLKSRILSFSEEDLIMDAAKIQQAKTMAADPQITVPEICKTRGISRNTYYKYVRPAQVKEQQA